MHLPQELVNEIIFHVEHAEDLGVLVNLLEASVPVFSPQISTNLRRGLVTLKRKDHYLALSAIAKLCPEIMRSVQSVKIERSKQIPTRDPEEELLAPLLDACNALRSLSITTNIIAWSKAIGSEEQRQAIYRAMQRPTLEFLFMSWLYLREADIDAFRALALSASLRIVRFSGCQLDAIQASEGTEVQQGDPRESPLFFISFDQSSLEFVRMLRFASGSYPFGGLQIIDYSSTFWDDDRDMMGELTRANPRLDKLFLRTDLSQMAEYDLSACASLSMLCISFTKPMNFNQVSVRNIAAIVNTLPESAPLATFSLSLPAQSSKIDPYEQHWRALENALLGRRLPVRAVIIRLARHGELVSSEETEANYHRRMAQYMPNVDKRGILKVTLESY
ncbi:uncharacterized protein SCHCODRAFT_02635879 [Schizophyllum commune H4-8]|nr:uncharacterized protein SCHCODRAFT_02635879 [Schizophyllum commune H4-8]KAI5888154.1 hypothetical protein SCHCODRAFT_02635879 [Schizophyllum commune H4-8]